MSTTMFDLERFCGLCCLSPAVLQRLSHLGDKCAVEVIYLFNFVKNVTDGIKAWRNRMNSRGITTYSLVSY